MSTAFSLCPFMVMLGSVYVFPGAGWCITSVFFVLIVKPKLLQASEKMSTLRCISVSEVVLSPQSSANRRSFMESVETLVFAWSLLRLKTDPSILYLIPIPTLASLKASVNIAENMRLNRVGAKTQPCFTPFVTAKGAEASPLSCTLAIIPSWNWRVMVMNFLGQPYFSMILQRPSLLTVSKALVRSTKVE